MSLRRRLVLVTVAVVAIAMTAADAGAYVALRFFLVSRAEQDLVEAANQSTKLLLNPDIAASDTVALENGNPNAAYALFDPSGALIARAAAFAPDKTAIPEPVLPDPATIPRLTADGRQLPFGAPIARLMVPAAGGGFDYLVTGVTAKSGSVVVIGWPLRDADATLRQLAIIEILVTLAILLLVALIATRLVALGLRPLAGIEGTAARIAGGDFGRRIEPVDPQTEVGRLGIALNTMLGRIEAALTAREASEQRLRRLVTDASHELRTPLTSLRGYAELFRRGADQRPADLARAMRGIELESERMAVLVDELLLLARLDEGHVLPSADEDLVPIVRAALDAARAVEPDRPLELRAPATALVRADRTRIRQVIDNLLANVRVHTPAGTAATVTVRAAGTRVILEVADGGPGMSDVARSRVFERFFRADPSRSRDSGGSGLGLAIVAAIVRAYGGEVAVESELGQGTRLIVEWPAALPPGSASADATFAKAPPEVPAIAEDSD
jgi:two-component system OmpR family sensor kinase